MAVIVGSARIDERGSTTGGKAGDQTGKEVSTQNWYLHSKGWNVLRCVDADKAEKIAVAMERACKNDKIGYDQYQRDSLFNQVKDKGFNPANATAACETDCSALVRVCCAFAGITLANFRTYNQKETMLNSKKFMQMKGADYEKSSAYLRRGDVLVTKTHGHTVVVLSNGSKAGDAIVIKKYALGDRILRNGCEGDDVKQMQKGLLELDYNLGKWGADGEFGDATELAVKAFQEESGLLVDGEFGSKSLAAFKKALDKLEDKTGGEMVEIVGGACYVRTEPNTSGKIIGAVTPKRLLPYRGQTSVDGWHAVSLNDSDGWVSGKYSRRV